MRKRFRLVMVLALALGGGGLVTPSALAALNGPAVSATPFRADDDDDKHPKVHGRDDENHNPSNNGSGCFYPPTNKPKINIFDPNKKFSPGQTVTLTGTVKIGKCGISGLKLRLYWSKSGGENGFFLFPVAEVTTLSDGTFTFTPTVTFASPYPRDKIFFRIFSDGSQYGFALTGSNIVKIEKK